MRISFQKKINAYETAGRPIVYLDESGFAVDKPRTHGYSEKGKPCVGQQDWHRKGRLNELGALIGKTWLTVCLVNGSVNADVFYAWLTQDLLPKIPPEAVLVMDNASFHKRQDILDAIQDSGTLLEFLPLTAPI